MHSKISILLSGKSHRIFRIGSHLSLSFSLSSCPSSSCARNTRLRPVWMITDYLEVLNKRFPSSELIPYTSCNTRSSRQSRTFLAKTWLVVSKSFLSEKACLTKVSSLLDLVKEPMKISNKPPKVVDLQRSKRQDTVFKLICRSLN